MEIIKAIIDYLMDFFKGKPLSQKIIFATATGLILALSLLVLSLIAGCTTGDIYMPNLPINPPKVEKKVTAPTELQPVIPASSEVKMEEQKKE